VHPETRLVSFVLRFVYEEPPPAGETPSQAAEDAPPGWHGSIRHVQSNAERHFTRWADALGFMSEYVEIKEEG
jgi:hypothetical protein